MKILAFGKTNAINSLKLAKYASSLFENAQVEFINFNVKTNLLAQKSDQVNLLIITLEEPINVINSSFKNCYDGLANIPNRNAFGSKPILLLTSSLENIIDSNELIDLTERFASDGSAVLESFSLPKFQDHFEGNEISTVALRLELIRKVNRIKQTHFSMYYKYEGFTCGIDPDRGGWHGDSCGY